jgi:hypothetical protein
MKHPLARTRNPTQDPLPGLNKISPRARQRPSLPKSLSPAIIKIPLTRPTQSFRLDHINISLARAHQRQIRRGPSSSQQKTHLACRPPTLVYRFPARLSGSPPQSMGRASWAELPGLLLPSRLLSTMNQNLASQTGRRRLEKSDENTSNRYFRVVRGKSHARRRLWHKFGQGLTLVQQNCTIIGHEAPA